LIDGAAHGRDEEGEMSVAAFEFATAGRIVFGAGTAERAGQIAAEFGGRAILLLGVPDGAPWIAGAMEAAGVESIVLPVGGEPTVDSVREAVKAGADAEVVVGYGGGSAIDSAKAVAALLANGGDPLDYLEIIGRGKPLTRPSLPCVAIPTTAGTGAEVTRNAVLGSPEHRLKVSLRSPYMLPSVALIDPLLTRSVPPEVTAATGMDALTQCLEPYVSNRPNPLTDALCLEGIARAARSLRRAFHDGNDAEAREDMCVTSLFGGLALANSRLGAVHGFAGPIGGMFPAPHGAVCGRLLPFVMSANVAALRAREPEAPALGRYAAIAALVTGRKDAQEDEGLEWVRRLVEELGLPPLREFGIGEGDIGNVVQKAEAASSMQGNPIKLTPAELRAVLAAAL
jgi:alcohol dehydrogenase class IV